MKNDCIIIGIDLAWGSINNNFTQQNKQKSDGVCIISYNKRVFQVKKLLYPNGDEQLLECIAPYIQQAKKTIIMIDAPIVCPNPKGARPVDRLTHKLFFKEHAACYPANSTKCSRPIRLAKSLKRIGFNINWNFQKFSKTLIEVYPHPAMVRLFRLKKIFKYKKGDIVNKQKEFRKYQLAFKKFLSLHFPELELNRDIEKLFKVNWNKKSEDLLDAFFCALLGMWHFKFKGTKSEIIGDLKTGFILLPADLRAVN